MEDTVFLTLICLTFDCTIQRIFDVKAVLVCAKRRRETTARAMQCSSGSFSSGWNRGSTKV